MRQKPSKLTLPVPDGKHRGHILLKRAVSAESQHYTSQILTKVLLEKLTVIQLVWTFFPLMEPKIRCDFTTF